MHSSYHLSDNSTIEQKIIISAFSPQIEFDNRVNWNETHKILKVEFPCLIKNDFATFETQFGVITRPTHNNTLWDMAKFEVCGHKFVDYSEFGYGLALLNDCKYGFSVRNNTISMSLLRSPKAPDATCDVGIHEFRYALLPHKGSFNESDVVKAAHIFNNPLLINYKGCSTSSLFTINKNNLVLETFKPCECLDTNEYIIRIYEAYGGRGMAKLKSDLKIKKAYKSNVLEEKVAEIVLGEDGIEFAFKPFEIITILLVFNKK